MQRFKSQLQSDETDDASKKEGQIIVLKCCGLLMGCVILLKNHIIALAEPLTC